ncbi:hypothetical protein [Microbulbifer sp. 2201CG32-9]|uniref:hypothetical protein n=1 Tax=unclassified Microbulbifer TaxID=2619833 RepID=UPI00345B5742
MKKLLKRVGSTCLHPLDRKARARELLEQPVFQQAVKDVMADLQREWLYCENANQREELHRQTRALSRVTEKLKAYYQPIEE